MRWSSSAPAAVETAAIAASAPRSWRRVTGVSLTSLYEPPPRRRFQKPATGTSPRRASGGSPRYQPFAVPKMVQGVGRKQHGPVTLVAGPRPPGVARHLERAVHPGAQDRRGVAMRAQAEGRAQVEGAHTREEERHGGSLIFRLSYGRASRRRRPWTTVDVVTFSRA